MKIFIRCMSTVKRIDKILIANRGEIACRVVRSAKRLDVQTVAVYSDSDRNAKHVFEADEAYNIGPSPANQSYLRGDKLLKIAKQSGCQAIHPGYGFLSENAEFAEQCHREGIIFIGPPASAIRAMGIKNESKEIMSKAGVPLVPGYNGEDQSVEALRHHATQIGFPLVIKAIKGGGGKGMRVVREADEFDEALDSAKNEALKAFGDGTVLLEKFVKDSRHVEVQIFADCEGNTVHLFERDCSVQRRHQKIIEEAPAPGLQDKVREELGKAAVQAAKAVGYVGAGTVEFIVDKDTQRFHFMEMNTRLQVEHPITEMITGVDLVEWQIKVASGETLPLTQEEIGRSGHAFEARIYAEDPEDNFLPGTGNLHYLNTPKWADDVRIEMGVSLGDEISVHYDPMIAKLVVWAPDRLAALKKLQTKLTEFRVAGLKTNVNFLLQLSRHPEFTAGNVYTNFIPDHKETLFESKPLANDQIIKAAFAVILGEQNRERRKSIQFQDQFNPFVTESAFRLNHDFTRTIQLEHKNQDLSVKIRKPEANLYEISVGEGAAWSRVQGSLENDNLHCVIDERISKTCVFFNDTEIKIFDKEGCVEFLYNDPISAASLEKTLQSSPSSRDAASKSETAPMPGIIERVLVQAGTHVKKGDQLFVLIAMKMEHVVKASRDGIVKEVKHNIGDNVRKNAVIVLFEEENEE